MCDSEVSLLRGFQQEGGGADTSQAWKPHALCGLSLVTHPFPLRTKFSALVGKLTSCFKDKRFQDTPNGDNLGEANQKHMG